MQYKIILEYSPSRDNSSVYLDLSAFLLNADEKVEGNDCLVYYRNPASPNKSVQYNGHEKTSSEKIKRETITVDVHSVPVNIHKIVFVVTARDGNNTAESIKLARETGNCSLFTNESEEPVHCFDFADTDFEGGAVFYEIARSQSGWTERVIAAGNQNTFHDFTQTYGIETKKIVLPSPPLPPPLPSPRPSPLPPPNPQHQQHKTIEENSRLTTQLTQLQEENKLLKQQLQTERNRITKLLEKCNNLVKENNQLLEQQLTSSDLLPELQMLFLESSQYHFAESAIKNALEICSNKLVKVQNFNAMLNLVEELRKWWSEYRIQNTIRLPFWRPDSWSRFEHKFPTHPVTIKLMYFIK
ncbi:MAG: TerD family protein [Planctomycetaceae bacterium]|jgi:stress response protein SCP2|nr:TerD family protein [Planctomycetaceae bacterium]